MSTAREYFTVELRCACRVTQCGLHYQVLRRDASPAHHPHPTRPRSCIGPSRPSRAATDAIADGREYPDPGHLRSFLESGRPAALDYVLPIRLGRRVTGAAGTCRSPSVDASGRCSSEPAGHSRSPLPRSRPDAGDRPSTASPNRERGLPTHCRPTRRANRRPKPALQRREQRCTARSCSSAHSGFQRQRTHRLFVERLAVGKLALERLRIENGFECSEQFCGSAL